MCEALTLFVLLPFFPSFLLSFFPSSPPPTTTTTTVLCTRPADPVQLTELFSDLLSQPTVPPHVADKLNSMGANVMSFRMPNNQIVTVLGSKNAGRYRVQGSSYDSLWLTVAELILRLRSHFGPDDVSVKSNRLISCADAIPLKEYYRTIETHFKARVKLAETESMLNDRAQQFRVVQKRLLVRFKAKNPAPLNNMDTLLRSTYQSLQELGQQAIKMEQTLLKTKGTLQCMTEIVLLRMRMQFKLDTESFAVLRSHLSPIVADTTVQGWEECVNAAMMHLLRTVLAKSVKDSTSVVQPLKFPSSTSKLQKHLTIVLKRMAAGKRGPRFFLGGGRGVLFL
jgi:Bardet-Biedl syndrome 9 protein